MEEKGPIINDGDDSSSDITGSEEISQNNTTDEMVDSVSDTIHNFSDMVHHLSTILDLTVEKLEDIIHNDINNPMDLLPHCPWDQFHPQNHLTLLQAVSVLGHWQFVPFLLELGADKSDPVPLVSAVDSEEPPTKELFAQFITEENVNAIFNKRTPIHHALLMGFYREDVRNHCRWDLIEELLDKGAEVNITCTDPNHNSICAFTCDPLILACSLEICNQQAKNCIKKIIKISGDLDRCLDGMTALEMAVNWDRDYTLELLLKYGASISHRCETWLLKYAVDFGARNGPDTMAALHSYRCVTSRPYNAIMHVLNDSDLYASSHIKALLNHLLDLLPTLTLKELHLKTCSTDLVDENGNILTFNIWNTALVRFFVQEVCQASDPIFVIDPSWFSCTVIHQSYEPDTKIMDDLIEMSSNPVSLMRLSSAKLRNCMIEVGGTVAGLDSIGLPKILSEFVQFRHVADGLIERMNDVL